VESEVVSSPLVRHNKNARPYRWSYDTDAEHAGYLERRNNALARFNPVSTSRVPPNYHQQPTIATISNLRTSG
jgi:hypothetical protein